MLSANPSGPSQDIQDAAIFQEEITQNEETIRSDSRLGLIDGFVLLALITLAHHGFTLSQGLIETAKIDFLEERVITVRQAWRAFDEQFHAVPGDFAYASVYIDSDLKNGNGNGRIDTDVEQGQAWAHLIDAGLLKPIQFESKPVSMKPGACQITRCLNNSWGDGMVLRYDRYGIHTLMESNQLLLGTNIPADTLWGLDRRLDDGLPHSGNIQISKPFPGFTAQDMNHCSNQKAPAHDTQIRCAGIVLLN
ncbi:MAG: hypothetical protein P8104_10305 [Gammaproteobacteria bacterium]